MSLSAGMTELGNGLTNVSRFWADVKEVWDDAMTREFEEQYLKLLEEHTRGALGVMGQLGPILEKARRDCS